MNIGFDGKRAANNFTGLGNYSRSLIGHLAARFPQHHYFVYSPRLKDAPQISSFFQRAGIFLKLPQQSGISFLWRSYGVVKQLLADQVTIYHGLSHELPFGLQRTPIRSVVTIHDLIYLRIPGDYKLMDRLIYDLKGKYACRHADRVIAISARTKQDLVELYGLNPDKIEVIYQSCDDAFKQAAPADLKAEVQSKYQLPEQFMLNVGTIEPRKNLLLAVQAMVSIPEKVKLVVVGKRKAYARLVDQEIARLGLEGRVIFLKDVPFSDLPVIYQLASVFVYPSCYEGFGIPVIEALFSNTPVVAATGSCLEEAGGPDSLYVHPEDAPALASAVNSVLERPELAAQMRRKGLMYVQKFDAGVLAAQLMECYRNLCRV